MPAAKPEPGRDPQMAERTQKLNVVFALSSLGLLLILSLMIWADYDREWKRHQLEFNKLEIQLTAKQIEEILGKVGAARKKALDDQLARGEQEIAARRDEVRKAQAEIDELHNEWYAADQDFRFTKAEIDVKRYEYEEAAHNRWSSASRRQASLESLEKKWAELRLRVEAVLARQEAARARLRELEKTKLDAEAKQKEILGEYTRLQDRLRKIEPGFVSYVRNLPVLDLANPSLRINQIMPANLYDDVVFTPTPKVERCTTCHLGIDQKGYEDAPQPFTTHPNLDLYLRGAHPAEKVGCTACHQGRGRATSFRNAAHTPSDRKQEQDWGKYTHSEEYQALHYWDLPMLARGHTESQCAKCHLGVVEVPGASKLNTGIFLMQKYGCYGCHKIKGWENLRKTGPDLSKVASKTDAEWMFRWVKEPRAFRPTRMPQVWDVRTQDQDTAERKARSNTEANAVVAYLMEKSARTSYPEPPKGELEAGRKSFESIGCMACHRIGEDGRGVEGLPVASFRAHGPNLDGTGSKLNAGWLYAWLRSPRSYWHETRMPNLRLSEKEAADLTAYLMSLKNEAFAAKEHPPLDAKIRDEILLQEYLVVQYAVVEARKQLAALDDRARTLMLGERVIARQGCFGCHNIAGFEKASPVGTEMTEEGSKLVERLDFGYLEHEIPHTLPAWLKQKFLEPRIFDRDKPAKRPEELLRMPKYFLSEEEADAIVTAVLSLTKEQMALGAQKLLSADEKHVELGRQLVRDYNCQGCHVIGARGGAIRGIVESQLVSDQKLDPVDARQRAEAVSPPVLYNEVAKIGEGARVHTPWLHEFLKDPSNKVRPWLEVRMPSFDLPEDELNTITRYFAAQDKVSYPYEPLPTIDPAAVARGRALFENWQCVSCHVVAGKLPPQDDPAMMAPDLALVPRRLRAAWLSQWLADPGRIQPGTRMPAAFPTNPEENAYPEILGGDQGKQIEAMRAYLLSLGGGARASGPTGR